MFKIQSGTGYIFFTQNKCNFSPTFSVLNIGANWLFSACRHNCDKYSVSEYQTHGFHLTRFPPQKQSKFATCLRSPSKSWTTIYSPSLSGLNRAGRPSAMTTLIHSWHPQKLNCDNCSARPGRPTVHQLVLGASSWNLTRFKKWFNPVRAEEITTPAVAPISQCSIQHALPTQAFHTRAKKIMK